MKPRTATQTAIICAATVLPGDGGADQPGCADDKDASHLTACPPGEEYRTVVPYGCR